MRRATPSVFALAFTVLAAASCGEKRAPSVWALTSTSEGVGLTYARWEPAEAVQAARRVGSRRIELDVRPGFRGRVRVFATGACPAEERFEDDGPRARTTELLPRLRVPRYLADVGYDHDVEIVATPGCMDLKVPTLTWRALGDAPLEVSEGGLRARTRTPSLSRALEPVRASLPSWGLVPLSPRTQGAIELEASWAEGGEAVTMRVRLVAASRATGVPTIPLGGRAYLFGEGWSVEPAPHAEPPKLNAAGGYTELDARAVGRFVLRDAVGRRLGVRFGRYDEMPLDCARAECHAEVGRTIQDSPMAHVFQRGMTGALGAGYEPGCALACHALGEPGADDGGFVHIARTLGVRVPAAPDPAWFASMPRELRRTSGVGCLACHGPAAIPEPSARWSVLRAEVCATCHDAPPRYGHAAAWRASRMATSDRRPETRQGECASCHTTAGFLVAIGARKDLVVPPEAEPLGLACAACHSPHARDVQGALVRNVPLPPFAPMVGASRVCLFCHGGTSAKAELDLSRASSAQLALAPGPHATPRGCLACHGTSTDASGATHGGGHAWKADASACRPCHAEPVVERPDARGRTLAQRADALWVALARRHVVPANATSTPHAEARYAIAADAPAALRDAARKVALVRDDKAAFAHNAAQARALLDEAEAAIR